MIQGLLQFSKGRPMNNAKVPCGFWENFSCFWVAHIMRNGSYRQENLAFFMGDRLQRRLIFIFIFSSNNYYFLKNWIRQVDRVLFFVKNIIKFYFPTHFQYAMRIHPYNRKAIIELLSILNILQSAVIANNNKTNSTLKKFSKILNSLFFLGNCL